MQTEHKFRSIERFPGWTHTDTAFNVSFPGMRYIVRKRWSGLVNHKLLYCNRTYDAMRATSVIVSSRQKQTQIRHSLWACRTNYLGPKPRARYFYSWNNDGINSGSYERAMKKRSTHAYCCSYGSHYRCFSCTALLRSWVVSDETDRL